MMMWPLPDDGSFYPYPGRWRPTDEPDVRLTYEVAESLLTDERTSFQRITVEVQNGVVILTGTVTCQEAEEAAAALSRRVPGVRDVCNGLQSTVRRRPEESAIASTTATNDDGERFHEIVAGMDLGQSLHDMPTRTVRRPPSIFAMYLAIIGIVILGWMVAILGWWVGVLVACAIGAVAVHMIRRRHGQANAGTERSPS